MRTAGSMQPYSDINIKKAIETGQIPGPKIQAIRNVEIVFKDGIGYDSTELFAAAKGLVGLR
jgi:hypothetical protein